LKNKNLNLPLKIVQGILDNYNVVADSINSVDYWVYNKDAHPENWIISDKITAIDFEATHLVPFTFDLANLFGYESFFDDNKIKKYISHYIEKSKEFGVEIDMDAIWPSYTSSLIHRLFSFVSAWSDPTRQKYAVRRDDALNRINSKIWNLSCLLGASSKSVPGLVLLKNYTEEFRKILKTPYIS
jgi:thiamine kinase-like enzyme